MGRNQEEEIKSIDHFIGGAYSQKYMSNSVAEIFMIGFHCIEETDGLKFQ